MPIIECLICRKLFETRDKRRKYCSRLCVNKANHIQKWNPKKGKERKCDVCGKIYYRSPARIGKYCSRECDRKKQITEAHRRHLSESHVGIKRTPEALAKFRKTMKKKWADLEFKAKFSQALEGHFVSEETKQKLSKVHLTISAEQEEQIIKLYASGLTATEIEVELNIGESVIFGCLKRNNIETRRIGIRNGQVPWNKDLKLSEEQKAKLNLEGLNIGHPWNKGKTGIYSEDRLKQMSEFMKTKVGEKANNWQGGISFEPYSPEFNNQLKYEIRKRDRFACQFPNCGIKENRRAHDCHHINYTKKDSKPENLIALCYSCHMKTNGNRDYWEAYFQELINLKYKEN